MNENIIENAVMNTEEIVTDSVEEATALIEEELRSSDAVTTVAEAAVTKSPVAKNVLIGTSIAAGAGLIGWVVYRLIKKIRAKKAVATPVEGCEVSDCDNDVPYELVDEE